MKSSISATDPASRPDAIENDVALVEQPREAHERKPVLFEPRSVGSYMPDRRSDVFLIEDVAFLRSRGPGELPVPFDTRRSVIFGSSVMFVFLVVLVSWSLFAKLTSAAIAEGFVSAAGSTQSVQHLNGGIAEEMLVEEGDVVTKGQLLMRLDSSGESSEISTLISQKAAMLVQIARLVAERDGQSVVNFQRPDLLLEFRPELQEKLRAPSAESVGDIADVDRDTRERLVRLIQNERGLFLARRDGHDSQIAAIDSQIQQVESELSGFANRTVIQRNKISLLSEELDLYADYFERGLVSRMVLFDLEQQMLRSSSDLSTLAATAEQSENKLIELRAQKETIENNFRSSVLDALAQARTSVIDVDRQLKALHLTVERSSVKAPSSGIVTNIRLNTAGAVLAPGAVILDLVPDNKRIVDIKIDPKDIDSIKPGLKAEIRLTAFSMDEYPMIVGEIESISADKVVDAASGISYYRSVVSLPDVLPQYERIHSGMNAEVMILTGEQSPMNYLINPIRRSFSRAMRE